MPKKLRPQNCCNCLNNPNSSRCSKSGRKGISMPGKLDLRRKKKEIGLDKEEKREGGDKKNNVAEPNKVDPGPFIFI